MRSTLSAEAHALQDGLDAVMFFKFFLEEACPGCKFPVFVKVDCKSLVKALQSTSAVEEKLLRINIAAIKQLVGIYDISISWVPGDLQMADSMTKKGASGAGLLTTLRSGRLGSIYSF